jgi:hypothetical protein
MMSKPSFVYRCDYCDRVVAELRDDGTLLIRQIHNKERHQTVIQREVKPEVRRAEL